MPSPHSKQEALLALVGSLTLGELTQTANVPPSDNPSPPASESDQPPAPPTVPETEDRPQEEGPHLVRAAFAFPVELFRATWKTPRYSFQCSRASS